MAGWQMAVVGIAAAAGVVPMTVAVWRMFARRAEAPATLREATAFESANVGGAAPEGAAAFDAFSYRVPGRLAGRVRIVVDGDSVSITGPRVPFALYAIWIWVQALMLAFVPALLVASVVLLDWRWLFHGLVLLVSCQIFSAVGAGIWPGMGETEWIERGRFKAIEFPRSAVRDVKIGAGWSDGGLDVVLVLLRRWIDTLAEGRAVSFFAPDDTGREVRYALHAISVDDAVRLAAALS